MPITDPTQEYFKDGAWGWNGTTWVKLPLVFGYYEQYLEQVTNLNASTGDNWLNGSVVPAGEIWVVTAATASNEDAACARIQMFIYDGAKHYAMGSVTNPVADQSLVFAGQVILNPGNRFVVRMRGVTAGNDLYFDINGYKMKVT